jgi:hypothetical protein
MKVEINNFVAGVVRSEVKKLYLSILYTAEDLAKDSKISDESFQILRKKILDYGNNSIRNLDAQLDNFDFNFKQLDNK